MSNRFGLLSVKNAELLAGLSRLVQRGNELTAEMLAHLAELEERRLHLQLGFPSLFAYCVEALGLSEGSAGRRVTAARVCRRFPEALALVARGDRHLSALCGLAPHANPQNATELFAACSRKSRRQVDELLAARFPKPDVRDQICRLPVRMGASAPTDDRIADQTSTREEALTQAGISGQGHEPGIAETARIVVDSGPEVGGTSAVDGPPRQESAVAAVAALPVLEPPPARRREIEPLSTDRFGVHFTADAELRELLERARALASHRLPKNDLSSLMRVVFAGFVKHEEARRFAVGRKPRRSKADAIQVKASSPHGAPPGGATPAVTSMTWQRCARWFTAKRSRAGGCEVREAERAQTSYSGSGEACGVSEGLRTVLVRVGRRATL